MKKFLDKLNNLLDNLDSEFAINRGGCCFVAAVIAQNLERYKIPYRARMVDVCGCYDEDLFEDCVCGREHCDCIGLFDDTCYHYFIEVSEGFINADDDEYSIILPKMIDSEDLFWIYETGDWNSYFKTENCDHIADCITKWFNETFSKRS